MILWAALALLPAATPGFAGIITTLTPTNRVDTATQTTITYTLTGAADAGTQPIGSYFFRVNISSHPELSNWSAPFQNITKAADGTPWGSGGPFTSTLVTPGPTTLRYQTLTVNGGNQLIDTVGGLIGTFDLVWNRPLTGQYDAALTTAYLTGSYTVAPSIDPVAAIVATGAGVSTIISATDVPEPGSMGLLGLGVCCGGIGGWLRRRRAASRVQA